MTSAYLVREQAYFTRQIRSTQEFWRRFGAQPDFEGADVLDLGCGHGAMSLDAARCGARHVVGVDIAADLVEFSRWNLESSAPELSDRVEFVCADLEDQGYDQDFDVVLSKDTFEHVDDLAGMVRTIFRALRPGGELWAGFSPLYWSPWGDHRRAGLKVPWAHGILPRSIVLRAAERHTGRPVHCLNDIGLNGLTPAEFRACLLRSSGLELVSLQYNRGDKPLLRAFDALRRVPALERWTTVGIYARLRRPG